MYKLLIGFAVCLSFVNAKEIAPTYKLYSTGLVSDFIVHKNTLYASTNNATVDIFDLKTKKIINQIILSKITTRSGEQITPRILSVDYYNNKLLIVSSGLNGFSNVWIYENYLLKNIVDEQRKLTIKEARFIDDERIIFGTFGSEIILHDTAENYHVYKSNISQSALGDFALSANKNKMVMADEGGEVKLIDIKSSRIEQIYSSENVDHLFHVAYSNGVIITAGKDRRVAVYQNNKKAYHIKSDFFVYCVGLSPSAKIGIYSSGEAHNLQLFSPQTGKKGDYLVGNTSVVNQIKFINENELFSSQNTNEILFYKLK